MAFLDITGIRVSYPESLLARIKRIPKKADRSRKYALNHFSLEVSKGERVAIVGPNGCGKTTLFKSISGFMEILEGRIEVAGTEVKHNPHELSVAMCMRLFDHLTVRANLTEEFKVWRYASNEIEDKLAQVCGLLSIEKELFGRKPRTLSSGQYQRVSVALALMKVLVRKSQTLLLDEPTASLDPRTKWEFVDTLLRALGELPSSVAVLYVTHDPEEALRFAKRVVVMNEGTKEQEGTIAELLANPTAFTDASMVSVLRQRKEFMEQLPLSQKSDSTVVSFDRCAHVRGGDSNEG